MRFPCTASGVNLKFLYFCGILVLFVNYVVLNMPHKTSFITLLFFCFLCFSSALQAVGSDKIYEYYYTPEADTCLVTNLPDAFKLGNDLANGEPLLKQYAFVMDSKEYEDSFFIEPLDLSYAFLLIAKRIGDLRADNKIKWITPYISDNREEVVRSIVYRKFSKDYLKKCFSIFIDPLALSAQTAINKPAEKKEKSKDPLTDFEHDISSDPFFELYMHGGY